MKDIFIFGVAGIALLCCALFLPKASYPGPLKEQWGEAINAQYSPPPSPEDRTSLAMAYAGLLETYPADLMRKKSVTLNEIVDNASSYVRRINESGNHETSMEEKLRPWEKDIKRASVLFGVPKNIIKAVIIMESDGDPSATATASSAKGLMQTINATFDMAKINLKKQGFNVNNPYNPKDSIMAGSWYLAYVYQLAQQDYPDLGNPREWRNWAKPLEYYYAGPVWGKSPKPIFLAHINGKRVEIKKGYYAEKVLEYAEDLDA